MKLFEAKSAAEISLEKVSFPKRLKRTRGAKGTKKRPMPIIEGTMVGVQGPREDPLDMIYQPEGQKGTRKLLKILTRHWADDPANFEPISDFLAYD